MLVCVRAHQSHLQRRQAGFLLRTASIKVATWRVTEKTEWRGGRAREEDEREADTPPTWRPDDLREIRGLWDVEKYEAWSFDMFSVKAFSWAMNCLMSLSGMNLHKISIASWYNISHNCWLVRFLNHYEGILCPLTPLYQVPHTDLPAGSDGVHKSGLIWVICMVLRTRDDRKHPQNLFC